MSLPDPSRQEPTIVGFARINITRHSLQNLQALASFLNIDQYMNLEKEVLKEAILRRQKEILSAYGLQVER